MKRLTQITDYCTVFCRMEDRKECAYWTGCVEMKCVDARIYDRLAAYEDLEEQGRLMILPCPMGSTIYMIVTKHTKGREPFSFIKVTELMESNVFRACREYGKTVFLTREEAERALEGVNGDAG